MKQKRIYRRDKTSSQHISLLDLTFTYHPSGCVMFHLIHTPQQRPSHLLARGIHKTLQDLNAPLEPLSLFHFETPRSHEGYINSE
jgi:hypothetical protein